MSSDLHRMFSSILRVLEANIRIYLTEKTREIGGNGDAGMAAGFLFHTPNVKRG